LLTDLETRMNKWGPNEKLGDLFVRMIDLFRVYTQYVKNFNNAITTIQEAKSKNQAFKIFLKHALEDPGAQNLDLQAYLIIPIQRIPRYKLLLQDMLDHTNKDHPDHADLSKACEKITDIAATVNEKKRDAENISKVLNIQDTLSSGGKNPDGMNLAEPHRRFIREGILVEIENATPKKRMFFLFNDVMVSAKPSKSVLTGTSSTKFKEAIKLDKAIVTDVEDTPRIKNAFVLRAKNKKHILIAATPEEKKEWVEDLLNVLDEVVQREKFLDEQTTKVAEQHANLAKSLITNQYVGIRVKGQRNSSSRSFRNRSTTESSTRSDSNVSGEDVEIDEAQQVAPEDAQTKTIFNMTSFERLSVEEQKKKKQKN